MVLNLDAFRATELQTEPFPHVVVPNFLSTAQVNEAIRDFPRIDMPGLFPPDTLRYGHAFDQLLHEMQGPELRRAVAEKFGVDVGVLPTLTTVRACARPRDGQIHLDAKFKVVTLLLYLNEPWRTDGGRLRLLRSGTDLENHAGEVSPEGGTLVAFQCTPNAWHGHKPFTGVRRYIMMNYVTDEAAAARELARHRLSARMKKFKRAFGIGRIAAA